MRFKDGLHQSFFEKMIARTHSQEDPYRKSLFYALGLTDETRNNINTLYDFKENGIEFAGLYGPHSAWQTGTSIKITRLAFNLYNGYCGQTDEEAADFTPESLFCNCFLPYMLEAVKIRYPDYARDENDK
jgi:hypothetical protein